MKRLCFLSSIIYRSIHSKDIHDHHFLKPFSFQKLRRPPIDSYITLPFHQLLSLFFQSTCDESTASPTSTHSIVLSLVRRITSLEYQVSDPLTGPILPAPLCDSNLWIELFSSLRKHYHRCLINKDSINANLMIYASTRLFRTLLTIQLSPHISATTSFFTIGDYCIDKCAGDVLLLLGEHRFRAKDPDPRFICPYCFLVLVLLNEKIYDQNNMVIPKHFFTPSQAVFIFLQRLKGRPGSSIKVLNDAEKIESLEVLSDTCLSKEQHAKRLNFLHRLSGYVGSLLLMDKDATVFFSLMNKEEMHSGTAASLIFFEECLRSRLHCSKWIDLEDNHSTIVQQVFFPPSKVLFYKFDKQNDIDLAEVHDYIIRLLLLWYRFAGGFGQAKPALVDSGALSFLKHIFETLLGEFIASPLYMNFLLRVCDSMLFLSPSVYNPLCIFLFDSLSKAYVEGTIDNDSRPVFKNFFGLLVKTYIKNATFDMKDLSVGLSSFLKILTVPGEGNSLRPFKSDNDALLYLDMIQNIKKRTLIDCILFNSICYSALLLNFSWDRIMELQIEPLEPLQLYCWKWLFLSDTDIEIGLIIIQHNCISRLLQLISSLILVLENKKIPIILSSVLRICSILTDLNEETYSKAQFSDRTTLISFLMTHSMLFITLRLTNQKTINDFISKVARRALPLPDERWLSPEDFLKNSTKRIFLVSRRNTIQSSFFSSILSSDYDNTILIFSFLSTMQLFSDYPHFNELKNINWKIILPQLPCSSTGLDWEESLLTTLKEKLPEKAFIIWDGSSIKSKASSMGSILSTDHSQDVKFNVAKKIAVLFGFKH